MDDREDLNPAALLIPYLMVMAAALLPLLVLRHRVRSAWRRRTPVAPQTWNLLHFLACYLLFIVLLGTASAVLQAGGFFELLYGPTLGTRDVTSPDAWGAVGGGMIADRALVNSKTVDQLRMLWGAIVAVPLVLFAVHGPAVAFGRRVSAYTPRDLVDDVLVGLAVAVVALPLVLVVHVVALYGHRALGGVAVDHPLTRLGAGSQWWETTVFWLSVCVLIPWVEELLFRGLLLRWAMSSLGASLLVFALAFVFAAAPGFEWNPRVGPLTLVVAALLFVLGFHRFGKTSRRRTVAGVLATSALFAAAHTPVWPSPIPLFVLGAILGLCVVKSGRITSAVVVHGFFNSVSFVYLIRNGPLG